MQWHSRSPEETARLAGQLAAAVGREGLVLALIGPLGAGKTAFVKGLAAGLGVDPAAVASPTFTIASEYAAAGRRLAHVDLFRVDSEAELEAAGFLDLLEPGAIVAVEWADRLPRALPRDRLELRIARPESGGGATSRRLSAVALGPIAAATLSRWSEAVARRGTPG